MDGMIFWDIKLALQCSARLPRYRFWGNAELCRSDFCWSGWDATCRTNKI